MCVEREDGIHQTGYKTNNIKNYKIKTNISKLNSIISISHQPQEDA